MDRGETYVVSVWVTDEGADPRLPAVRVGHNTETAAQAAVDSASSELEARWNFAFYLQDELAFISDDETDPVGARLRREWIEQKLGAGRQEAEVFTAEDDILNSFIHLLVRVVQRVHADGVVTETFGRPIPVLIHELEYYDAILEQNLRANPPETMAGFGAWFDDGLG
jgi:hypothetical protein